MTQREELKPCPFCGSAAEDGMGYNYHKVCCSSLACRMSNMYFTKKEWNMRAKAQAVPNGYRLMPPEPTPEMIKAWRESTFSVDPDENLASGYDAMFLAAPEVK